MSHASSPLVAEHLDLSGPAGLALGQLDAQHAVLEVRLDLVGVDLPGERHGPREPALGALAALPGRAVMALELPLAVDGQLVAGDQHFDIFDLQARQLGLDPGVLAVLPEIDPRVAGAARPLRRRILEEA